MKKALKNLILFLIFANLSSNLQSAFGYVLTPQELTNYITKETKKEIKEQISQYSNDFKINITGILKENIVTNETNAPKIEIINQNQNFKTNSYKRVVIKDLNNRIIKSFPINVQTLVYQNVLVANDLIQYGKEINSQNTKLERREISRFLGKTIQTNSINQISTKNYPKGSIILTDSIKEKSAILKNSTIDIVFVSSKGLNIKIQGKALSQGAIGETILVRSDKYNKTYNAIVNSSNQVTVRI